jgi:hypothetical protein
MERNWLIRTYQKQILGPVSKQKLLEFIQKGSVGFTDEVSSGNGYWFFLKEKDLVDRYLHGDIPQSFNPVSESKSVLIFRENSNKTTSLNSSPPNNRLTDNASNKDVILPTADDLEYPDVTLITAEVAEFPDITIISHLPSMPEPLKLKKEKEIAKVNASKASVDQLFPVSEDLDYPDIPGPVEPAKKTDESEHRDFKVEIPVQEVVNIEVANAVQKLKSLKLDKHELPKVEQKLLYERKTKIVSELELQPAQKSKQPVSQPRVVAKELEKRNDNYLFVIFFIVLIILCGVFFYYKEILNKPLPI